MKKSRYHKFSYNEKTTLIIALVLVVISVVSFMYVIARNAKSTNKFEVSKELQGSGTEVTPYLIGNRADLLCFSQNLSEYNGEDNVISYVALTADIDLGGIDWVPIGLYKNQGIFSGVFDGNGHTISNCKILSGNAKNVGFFSEIGTKNFGITGIKDLNLSGITIFSNNNHYAIGGLVGSSRGVISNCIVSANITTNGDSSALGGVAGYAFAEVFDCVSYGNMTVTISETRETASDVFTSWPVYGGVVGGALESKKDISNCTNNMEINFTEVFNTASASQAIDIQIGGVVGFTNGSQYTNLTNNADIVGVGSVGGIICDMFGEDIIISNCINNGNLYSTSGCNLNVGGILAKTFTTPTNKIINCANNGKITAVSKEIVIGGKFQNFMAWCGGIMGLGKATIENCKSTGAIDINGEVSHYVGGIIGGNSGIIKNCYSTSEITVNSGKTAMVGGLAGVIQNEANLAIESSYYNGKLQAKISDAWNTLTYKVYVGGIIGYNMSKTCSIKYNYYNTSLIPNQVNNQYTTPIAWYGEQESPDNITGAGIIGNNGITTTDLQSTTLQGFTPYAPNTNPNGVWILSANNFPKLYWEK